MNRRLALFVLPFCVLISGCFDSGTDPGATNDPGEEDSFTLEATATMGQNGGVLASAGFELAVPSGAFTGDKTIELYSSSEERPFGESCVSKAFRVEGIPFDCMSPLRLAIAYNDTLSDSSFIAIGEEVHIPTTGEQTIAYRFLDAVDSSGYLVATIPEPDPETDKAYSPFGSPSDEFMKGILLAISRQKSRQAALGLFRVYFDPHKNAAADAESLYLWLAAGFAEMELLGFDPEPRRTSWPVHVHIRDLGDGTYGRFVPSPWRGEWASFEFNGALFHQKNEIKAAAYHEAARFVEYVYVRARRYQILFGTESNHLWLDEAIAAHIEEFLTEDYLLYQGPIGEPMTGLQAGAASDARSHGHGLTSMVNDLRWHPPTGSGTFGDVYDLIASGTHPIPALASTFGDLDTWYPDYMEHYTFVHLSYPEQDTLIRNIVDEFPIASANDTLRTFTHAYPDLSGRLFRIPLGYTGLDDDASLNFATRGRTAGIHVYRYFLNGDPPRYRVFPIISSVDDVSVVNVKDLMAENAGILALITNGRWVSPYTETSDITLTIQLAGDPPYRFGYYRLDNVLAEMSKRAGRADPRDQISLTQTNTGEGSFVGNTFVGTWNEPEFPGSDVQTTGTITIVLNAAKDSVLSVTVEKNIDWDSWTTEFSFTAQNIPRDYGSSADMGFAVFDDPCDHMVDLEYETLIGYPGGPSTLQSYSCTDVSELEILFWKEL